MSSQAGISAGRAVSSVSGGTIPSSFCRASVSSRSASQPASKRPLYFADHSSGTWCGACVPPGARYAKNGLSGISDFCWRIHVIVRFGQVLGEVVALLRRAVGLDR